VQLLLLLDSVLLTGGQTIIFSYSGDGRTWRLEVDQHPLHPGYSRPNATVELCGNQDNWTPNLVTILPQDDADPIIDIYCNIVTGSYDPNDKNGFPLGSGIEHNIYPNGKLDYLIRFQNTGNDTAFTVVIRDTLDIDLDIFSVKSGASSHNYTFKIYGPRVLEWTFNNIMLPDSTTDLEGSNGFVFFTVNQNKNLADGTEINNTADIYFDFNDPIITNTTSHIIDRGIKNKKWQIQKSIDVVACEYYEYNNISYSQSGKYFQKINGINEDSLVVINLTLNSNPDTSIIKIGNVLSSVVSGASYQWINCINNTIIDGETNHSFKITETGAYALEISKNGCVDTSSCRVVIINAISPIQSNLIINSLYPNPTNGLLYFEINESAEIKIFNSLGKLLLNDKGFVGLNSFDLNHLDVGVYYLEIFNNQNRNTIKFVIEK
jgi:uncharacterized repeat protein (TIGR01451 family)